MTDAVIETSYVKCRIAGDADKSYWFIAANLTFTRRIDNALSFADPAAALDFIAVMRHQQPDYEWELH